MEDIDKEISEMKITLNARARIVAEEFLKHVRHYCIVKCYHCFPCSFDQKLWTVNCFCCLVVL